MAHDHAVAFLRGAAFVEAVAALSAVHRLATGETREDGVACGIDEERRGVARLDPCARVDGYDGGYATWMVLVHLYGVDVLSVAKFGGWERDIAVMLGVALHREGDLLAEILVVFGVVRVAVAVVWLDVADDAAERRILSLAEDAAHRHAHLGGVAATKHVAVL